MTAGIQAFDASLDLSQAVLWQYDGAPRLQALLGSKQAWYDAAHTAFWDDWYRDVFNLQTANDFGLSVWSIILGVPLIGAATPSGARPVFGFGDFNLNFHESNFGRDAGTAIILTTEQKRLILRLRFFQLVTRGCVTEINDFLAYLFGSEGVVYVLDGLDMSCEYVFTFYPDPKILYVLENYDILPRPAGVRVRVLINPGDSFGFDPYYLNFHAANFAG